MIGDRGGRFGRQIDILADGYDHDGRKYDVDFDKMEQQ